MSRHCRILSVRLIPCLVALVASVALAQPKAASQPAPEPPPAAADWELPAVFFRDNGYRGEVPLNAWWKAQAADSDVITRVRVPDYGYSLKRKDFTHERTFAVPQNWSGRRLTLEVGNFSEAGVVYFDGQEIARLNAKSRYHELPLPGEAVGGKSHTIRIVSGVIGDDVVLRSYPASDGAITDSYIITSTRKNEVSLQLAGRAKPNSRVAVSAKVWSDEKATDLAKELPAQQVPAGADGAWSVTLTEKWADAKRWSQWSPNLYWYTVDLSNEDGMLVDRVLPRRFGFREVWVEGRQVMLNGVPVHFMGDNWPSQTGSWSAMPQMAEAVVRNAKAMGLTGGYRTDSNVVLDACDKVGMLVTYQYLGALDIPVERLVVGKDEAGDPGGDVDQVVAEKLDASKERILRWLRKYREHPSILTWTARAPWARMTLNSLMIGNVEDPWNYWPGNNELEKRKAQFEAADQNIAFIRAADPSRPVTAQNSPKADIELATRYLCDNLDLQEREQFFEAYARGSSTKAIWSSEHGAPFQGHQFLRKQAHQQPQGGAYPAIHVENAARLFGDSVYLDEPEARLKQWSKWNDAGHRLSPVFQRLVAENVWLVHRGWRTAGVSAHCHWIARDGFLQDPKIKTAEDRWGVPAEVDPRQPGLSKAGNATVFPSLKVDAVLPAGEAYMRSIAPLLMYVGGSESPGRKDHLYVSGAEVRKRVIVLNDYDTPVHVSGTWQLVGADESVALSGTLDATLAPGERAIDRLPITFTSPKVTTRTDFSLRVTLDAGDRGTLRDAFAITIFPAMPDAPSAAAKLWVPKNGEQNALMTALGKAGRLRTVERGEELKPDDVILIPRNYLATAAGVEELQRIGFDDAVRRGVRAIVFEQDLPNILGVRTEDVRPRRAFISADGHPAFTGLSGSDLTYWTGASDLQPAAEPMPESDRFRFPERIWQVSNDNAVATRTLIRPQVGAARALAVSGFDLAETPLLESAIGAGRVLMCQFDVSNRYGVCPVATRLVDNLIGYAASAPAPDIRKSEIDIVAGPSVTDRPNLYRASKPSGDASWGMTNAEFFFRESIYVNDWITKGPPKASVRVFAGDDAAPMPQVIRRDAATGRYATTLSADQFTTGWQKRKIAFLHAAMRINQGGSSEVGPSLANHGDGATLNPIEWLNGFVNPYTAACW